MSKMTLYIADRLINGFMAACDLRPEHKQFVTPVIATCHKEPTQDYFEMILEKGSKLSERFWIVAVLYENTMFCHKGIKCLSDGDKEMWITELKK